MNNPTIILADPLGDVLDGEQPKIDLSITVRVKADFYVNMPIQADGSLSEKGIVESVENIIAMAGGIGPFLKVTGWDSIDD